MIEKGKWLLEKWKENLFFFYVPFSLVLLELTLHLLCFGQLRGESFGFILLFSGSTGLLLAGGCSLLPRRAGQILFSILFTFLTVIFVVQTIYFHVFNTFTTIFSAAEGGKNIFEYWREILSAVGASALVLLLVLSPLVCWFIFRKHLLPKRKGIRTVWIPLVLAVTLYACGAGIAMLSDDGDVSPKYLYSEAFQPKLATEEFGILTMLRLDIKNLVWGMETNLAFDSNNVAHLPTIPTESVPVVTEKVPTDTTESSTAETTAVPTPTPTPTPIVYQDNIMDIDFEGLIEASNDKTLTLMHEYFSSLTPTKQNEYTGIFAGKNLIWICAEGFSPLALHPELTPTLCQLSQEGFVFENFYNPIWGVSTSDGEYTTCTGLIPKSGVWSFYQSGTNSMPFTFGHQFGNLGYAVNAYHNHTYNYYNRDVSHPNMGYEYKGIGNGLTMETAWPRSDLEMMEVTVDEYIGEEPFHTYYMTVSGHLQYNFGGNAMAARHKDEVADLPYSIAARAYIACNLELEYSVRYLIERLDAEGILDDTVIVLSNDHYPYGLEKGQMDELAGHTLESEFEMYASTLILWSSEMEEPVRVEKPCSPIDILPTLSNLFGIEYDSRLLIGQDILSDAPGLVMFNNRSWITDYGRYNASRREFVPLEGITLPEDYQELVSQQVKYKFDFSAKILEKDYYSVVFPDS